MQTHDDYSHKKSVFLRELKMRANRMLRERQSEITAGSPDEQTLAQWNASNGMQVVHRPDDPHGVLRISIGGGPDTPVRLDYCTIRGGVGKCIDLLEKAIAALRESPE